MFYCHWWNLELFFHSKISFQIRKDLVEQREGQGTMRVKAQVHFMKRVTERERKYFYTPIHRRFFPYSLAIALPEKYGEYRVSGGFQPSQMSRTDGKEFRQI